MFAVSWCVNKNTVMLYPEADLLPYTLLVGDRIRGLDVQLWSYPHHQVIFFLCHQKSATLFSTHLQKIYISSISDNRAILATFQTDLFNVYSGVSPIEFSRTYS